GYFTGSCNTARTAPKGTWNANLSSVSLSGYATDLAKSTKSQAFKLQ
ncbi:MAG: hypothetical protein HZB53_00955, partial [Chloroflexi bacterium]|nr:hypothetical protein [Chloroflexota bacterium]